MINLINLFNRKLLGKSRSKHQLTVDQDVSAPGTKIIFDSKLVSQLKDDHIALLTVFAQMRQCVAQKHSQRINELLSHFLVLFNEHALTEYSKLYIFLDYAYRENKEYYDVIRNFRTEMNHIGKVVRKFCRTWIDEKVRVQNLGEFSHQLEEIGDVLMKRVSTEEERLYKLYAKAPVILYNKLTTAVA